MTSAHGADTNRKTERSKGDSVITPEGSLPRIYAESPKMTENTPKVGARHAIPARNRPSSTTAPIWRGFQYYPRPINQYEV